MIISETTKGDFPFPSVEMAPCYRCGHEIGRGHEFEIVVRPRRARVAGETTEVSSCRWCATEIRAEITPDRDPILLIEESEAAADD
jgi:hypothetical protein